MYETARYLDIKAVTYEFGDPNRRVWLAQNKLVIHHNNDELWSVHKRSHLKSRTTKVGSKNYSLDAGGLPLARILPTCGRKPHQKVELKVRAGVGIG